MHNYNVGESVRLTDSFLEKQGDPKCINNEAIIIHKFDLGGLEKARFRVLCKTATGESIFKAVTALHMTRRGGRRSGGRRNYKSKRLTRRRK